MRPNKELSQAAKDFLEYQKAYDEAEKNGMYNADWQQKFLLKQLAIKLKKEQMSKQQFKVASRKSIFSEVGEYCYLSKEHDYIEVTEWSNADGFDIDLSCSHGGKLSLTWGQYRLLKKLVKQLDKEYNESLTQSAYERKAIEDIKKNNGYN